MIAHDITSNIIKDNKVYHVKKTIKMLESIIKKYRINNSIFRKKHIFLIDNSYTPVERFALEYCLKNLESIKYELVKEEDLLNEKNALVIWDEQINIVEKSKVINIKTISSLKKDLKNKNYILIGCSDRFEEHKNKLSQLLEIEILEYENSDTILFDRVK